MILGEPIDDDDIGSTPYHWTTVAGATLICVVMAMAALMWWAQFIERRPAAVANGLWEEENVKPVVCG